MQFQYVRLVEKDELAEDLLNAMRTFVAVVEDPHHLWIDIVCLDQTIVEKVQRVLPLPVGTSTYGNYPTLASSQPLSQVLEALKKVKFEKP